ncbi:Poly(A)-specific ribonuclease [Heracleum sosnowskyi]|uniref:poly(A)-specific ribonuclease n=1 Tax=Heracleum sosnowskyi TaxID=360622 RepID=A0AAD8IIS7_9APIA|nr:Poly(A)-specific ribonuclease [Heracleum sosnowskyi]
MDQVAKKAVVIREVWEGNLEFEFSLIRSAVKSHSCISIDTEFPGTVIPDIKNRKFYDLNPEETYSLMKANVDASKLIQLGLTLSDEHGNLPDFGSGACCVWQFNFREFDVDKDLQEFSSIELLKRNGIDFSANKMHGVRSEDFARLFRGCFGPNCTWVTFHGGYDFGYLTKALTNSDLPRDLGTFRDLLSHYFGISMYDVKAMMEPFRFRGGLESLAACFNLVRVAGKSHQAGSDSLLTMQVFMKVKEWCISRRYATALRPCMPYGLNLEVITHAGRAIDELIGLLQSPGSPVELFKLSAPNLGCLI